MEYKALQPKKPENIALSFSGGGFRAAAYTLGCLSYMEMVRLGDAPMMSAVKFISSASGGTITNLSFIQSQRKGQSFQDYYTFMNEHILYGSKLLDRVFSIMTDQKRWQKRPGKSRNFINAFSIAYDELLFKEETFGVYFDGGTGVEEVCANTTDFDNGMLFRFQNCEKYGNHFLYFKVGSVDVLKKIKLGDILAASSCFPVGFEPFMFPQDFTHPQLSKTELEAAIYENPVYQTGRKNKNGKVNVGFMDGGIDDNQGIASFMLAEERKRNRNRFGYDLYLSCDVSSNYTSGFDFPAENKKAILLKPALWQYALFFVLLFILSVMGIRNEVWTGLSYMLAAISGVAVLAIIACVAGGINAYQKADSKKNTYGLLILGRIGLFLRLRLSVLLLMLNARTTSAGYLASVVFLKKIRRSSYDRLFESISERKYSARGTLLAEDADESLAALTELKHWRKFLLQNAVYLLSPKNNFQRKSTLKKEPWYQRDPILIIDGTTYPVIERMKPSAKLQAVADLATEMDTTLWYDKYHMQDNRNAALIATGQFTTCYNLLRYAMRFDSNDPYWSALQLQLAKDWQQFNDQPYWLYNEYGKTISGFKPVE